MSLPSMLDYLGPERSEVLFKTAEEEKKSPAKHIAKTIGAGAAGTGIGYLAGGGAAHLANKAYSKMYGKPIPSSALLGAFPVLGAGAGLAYSLYKAQEQEEIRRALESTHDHPAG